MPLSLCDAPMLQSTSFWSQQLRMCGKARGSLQPNAPPMRLWTEGGSPGALCRGMALTAHLACSPLARAGSAFAVMRCQRVRRIRIRACQTHLQCSRWS